MEKLRVTLVKSTIGCPRDQRVIVRTLGLKKTNSRVFLEDSPAVRGALNKVRHLVEVDVSRQSSVVSRQSSVVRRKKQTKSLTIPTTNDQRPTTNMLDIRRKKQTKSLTIPTTDDRRPTTNLHTLTVNKNARPKRTRKGQGIGSGLGKTAGRGHKGQKARSGSHIRPGFEGGQMPLQRRIPKRGFSNAPFKKQIVTVNLNTLNHFPAGAIITPEVLLRERKIKKIGDGVKILGQGELKKVLVVRLHAFSKSAAEKIKAAGGKTEVI